MVELYTELIRKGLWTLSCVPEIWIELVAEKLGKI